MVLKWSIRAAIVNNNSVSAVRPFAKHLDNGDFELAEQMLGRPYQMMGKVVHGRKNGRTIGFPTANIPLKRLKSPLHGVFRR